MNSASPKLLAFLLVTGVAAGCSGEIGGDDIDAGARVDAHTSAGTDGAVDAYVPPGTDAGHDAGGAAIGARFFNVMTGEADPRFATVPTTLPMVRMLPRVTFVAEVEADVRSVRFTLDGESTLDGAAPFRAHEDDAGAPTPWSASVGTHTLLVETFAAADGTSPLGSASFALELTSAGADPTPGEGAHSTHLMWVTNAVRTCIATVRETTSIRAAR